MTTMLLATVVAMRLAAAPQSFDVQAGAGKTVHLTVTSQCSCLYKPQPTVVVPEIDVFDANGNHVEIPDLSMKATSRGTADYQLQGEIAFTVPKDGTYSVRVKPQAISGYVDAIRETFSSGSFAGKVMTSSERSIWTPIAASQSGRVTITVD